MIARSVAFLNVFMQDPKTAIKALPESGGEIQVVDNEGTVFFALSVKVYDDLVKDKFSNFTLPEQTELGKRINNELRDVIYDRIGFTTRMFSIIGDNDKLADHSVSKTCRLHPLYARALLTKQYFFDIEHLGYVVSDEDKKFIQEHSGTLRGTAPFDLFKVYMLCPALQSASIDVFFHEVIRIIEDKEWFIQLSKALD